MSDDAYEGTVRSWPQLVSSGWVGVVEVVDPLDDGESIVCSTRAEAIAMALAEVDPGDEIVVHAGECQGDADGEGCDCEPEIIVAGERVTS